MRAIRVFAIFALLPAAMNAGSASASVSVPLCTGDGLAHTITLPIGQPGPGRDGNPCCAKGCHAGGNRKRIVREFDPSQ